MEIEAAPSSPAFPFTAESNETERVSSPEGRKRANVLGREMVELTAHISAAEARFFELLAEVDRDALWRCLGCHSAAQWLTWQCGLGEVAARERVRVARALEKLPKIGAALRRGEISYSKVREPTRVARPETEDALLNVALHGTAAQVQRVVAQHCRAERVGAAADAMEQFRQRYVRYRDDGDGTVLIQARLPAEIGEVVIRAIDAAVEVLYRDAAGRSRAGENRVLSSSASDAEAAGMDCVEAGDVEAVGNSTDRAETHVPAGTPTHGNSGRTSAPDNVETAADVPAGTLTGDDFEHAATVEGIETRNDFPAGARSHDGVERARKLGQNASNPAGESRNVSAGTEAAPITAIGGAKEQIPSDTVGSAQSREDHEVRSGLEPLAARGADGLRLLADSFLSAPAGERVDTTADRYQVVVHIDHALLSRVSKAYPPGGDPHRRHGMPFALCEVEDGCALAVETARRLGCDATLVGIVEDASGEPLNVGRRTRAISPALRRALRARDGGCRFPGCCRTRFTHARITWSIG